MDDDFEELHNEILSDITKFFHNVDLHVNTRLDKFSEQFDKQYPKSDLIKRTSATTLTYALFGPTLMLYSVSLNGYAIIELHALLEFVIKNTIINHLKINPKNKTLRRILDFQTLDDYTKIMRDMGVFNRSDLRFIEKVIKLRNGVAHKNTDKIKDYINSGISMSYLDIYYRMGHYEILPFILKSIELIIKTFEFSHQTKIDKDNKQMQQ